MAALRVLRIFLGAGSELISHGRWRPSRQGRDAKSAKAASTNKKPSTNWDATGLLWARGPASNRHAPYGTEGLWPETSSWGIEGTLRSWHVPLPRAKYVGARCVPHVS